MPTQRRPETDEKKYAPEVPEEPGSFSFKNKDADLPNTSSRADKDDLDDQDEEDVED